MSMAFLPYSPSFRPKLLIDCVENRQLKDLVLHASHSIQVCEDSMLLNILGALNTAINGMFIVKRPNGHTEHPQFFVLIIGRPGERKSAACAWSKRPLVIWISQQASNQGYARRLHFDQVSGSSLLEALCKCGGRLVCHEPEPTILTVLGRRNFSKVVLNKGYDGEEMMLDRAGKPSICIKDPAISMWIASQPEIAHDFGRRPDVSSSGLLGRFLFLESQPRAGMRMVDTPPIPEEAEAYYCHLIVRLLEYSMPADGKRHILTLDQRAEKSFHEFARQAESELAHGRALSFDLAWGSKLPGKILRLGVLLHCIEHEDPAQTPISEGTIRQAIEMSDVFVQHARDFYFMVQNGETLEVAQQIEGWASNAFLMPFTAQQAQAALHRYTRRMVNAGIEMLVRSGRAYEDLSVYQNSQWRRGRKAGPFYRLKTFGGIISP